MIVELIDLFNSKVAFDLTPGGVTLTPHHVIFRRQCQVIAFWLVLPKAPESDTNFSMRYLNDASLFLLVRHIGSNGRSGNGSGSSGRPVTSIQLNSRRPFLAVTRREGHFPFP